MFFASAFMLSSSRNVARVIFRPSTNEPELSSTPGLLYLARAANLARAHTGSLSTFRIGKEKDPCPVDTGAGPTAWSAIDFCSLVTPNCGIGNARCLTVHRKTFASQQLQFTRYAATISTDSSVRQDHAMARDIYGHRIVVHCIADSPRAACRARCGA